uniref:Uncharacterized protein n=1 Tax=Opuntia streptacantha TaxID=393608 RepID=A0A7C8YR99_OPUST
MPRLIGVADIAFCSFGPVDVTTHWTRPIIRTKKSSWTSCTTPKASSISWPTTPSSTSSPSSTTRDTSRSGSSTAVAHTTKSKVYIGTTYIWAQPITLLLPSFSWGITTSSTSSTNPIHFSSILARAINITSYIYVRSVILILGLCYVNSNYFAMEFLVVEPFHSSYGSMRVLI